MGKQKSNMMKLDRVISALERLILAAPDEEILAEDATETHYVKEIIDKGIAMYHTSATRSGASEEDMRPRSKKRHPQMPSDWQAKIAFFRNLVTTHPDLSPRLGAVFGGGRTPTTKELDDLTNELARLGLIARNGSKKK